MKKIILILLSFVMLMSFTGCFGAGGTGAEDMNTEEKGKDGIALKGEVKTSALAEAAVGDLVKFGKYEQDNNKENGKEDVEWIVLAKEDNKILVISRQGLDCVKYLDNGETGGDKTVTWESSTIRTWLNGTFISEAFAEEEQAKLSETKVTAEDNKTHGTDAGNDTTDKVFLLSVSEADKYFKGSDATASNNLRKCKATAYAKEKGAWSVGDKNLLAYWSLRTPGYDNNFVSYVDSDGKIRDTGLSSEYKYLSVRPAMWIEIGE